MACGGRELLGTAVFLKAAALHGPRSYLNKESHLAIRRTAIAAGKEKFREEVYLWILLWCHYQLWADKSLFSMKEGLHSGQKASKGQGGAKVRKRPLFV